MRSLEVPAFARWAVLIRVFAVLAVAMAIIQSLVD